MRRSWWEVPSIDVDDVDSDNASLGSVGSNVGISGGANSEFDDEIAREDKKTLVRSA